MRELGMFLTFEVTRDYALESYEVEAPSPDEKDERLRSTSGKLLKGRKMALVPIIPSGLVLAEGMLEVVPTAKIGHLGLSRGRTHTEIVEYFVSLPETAEREFILVDPVIGTGAVACHAIKILKAAEVPSDRIRFATVLASRQGLAKIAEEHSDIRVFPLSIEEGLDAQNHVYPGFGDSSQRLFGTA